MEGGNFWVEGLIEKHTLSKRVTGILLIIGNWTSALLYVFSEMWGTVVLSLLFWGFANDICTINEAKRFYTVVNLGANASLIFCGVFLIILALCFPNGKKDNKNKGKQKDGIDEAWLSMMILMGMVVASGIGIIYLYRWMQKNVLTDPKLYDPSLIKPKKKKDEIRSMGFFEACLWVSLYCIHCYYCHYVWCLYQFH